MMRRRGHSAQGCLDAKPLAGLLLDVKNGTSLSGGKSLLRSMGWGSVYLDDFGSGFIRLEREIFPFGSLDSACWGR